MQEIVTANVFQKKSALQRIAAQRNVDTRGIITMNLLQVASRKSLSLYLHKMYFWYVFMIST